ncbi:hypothetical protein ACTS94_16280 [Empedobacter falsenii]
MKKSILIKSEEDFNKVKNLLGDDLYITWTDQFLKYPTSIIVKDVENSGFGVGSIGEASYQKKMGYEILDTNLNVIEL